MTCWMFNHIYWLCQEGNKVIPPKGTWFVPVGTDSSRVQEDQLFRADIGDDLIILKSCPENYT